MPESRLALVVQAIWNNPPLAMTLVGALVTLVGVAMLLYDATR